MEETVTHFPFPRNPREIPFVGDILPPVNVVCFSTNKESDNGIIIIQCFKIAKELIINNYNI